MSDSKTGRIRFFTRPVSCVLLVAAIFGILWSLFGPAIIKKIRKGIKE